MSLQMQFEKLWGRISDLVAKGWTGKITIEISLTQGALGSIYFTAKEQLTSSSVKRREARKS